MFNKLLTRAGQVRRFTVDARGGGDGWEVRVEQDSAILRRQSYTDWHRVERALTLMEDEVLELEEHGWQLLPSR